MTKTEYEIVYYDLDDEGTICSTTCIKYFSRKQKTEAIKLLCKIARLEGLAMHKTKDLRHDSYYLTNNQGVMYSMDRVVAIYKNERS